MLKNKQIYTMGIILTTVLVVLASCGGQTTAIEPKEPTNVVNPAEQPAEPEEPNQPDQFGIRYDELEFTDDRTSRGFFLPSRLAEAYKDEKLPAADLWQWLVGDFTDLQQLDGQTDLPVKEAGDIVTTKQFYFEKVSYRRIKTQDYDGSMQIVIVKTFTDEELIDLVNLKGQHPTHNEIGFIVHVVARKDINQTNPILRIKLGKYNTNLKILFP